VAIGAPDNGGNGYRSGHVRVYDWINKTWKQLGGDITGNNTGERFGYSVSLSADSRRVAIGNHWDKDNGYNAGQVQVYTWSGTDWHQLLEDINGSSKMDNFGVSVSLSGSGSRVAAGAPSGAGTGGYEGSV
jgi:hypothetical protein